MKIQYKRYLSWIVASLLLTLCCFSGKSAASGSSESTSGRTVTVTRQFAVIPLSPVHITVSSRRAATCSVTADGGAAPYTFQWQRKEGSHWQDLKKCTAAHCVVTAAGEYRCAVRDSSGAQEFSGSTFVVCQKEPVSVPSQPAIPELRKSGKKTLSIVFIGDSIVEGYGASDYNGGSSGKSGHRIENNVKTWYRNTGKNAWVNRMIDYLETRYDGVTACNNGVGGFTGWKVFNNLDTLARDDSGRLADVIILSIGTNNRESADKTASITDPIVQIIRWAQERRIRTVVLSNTPLMNTTPGSDAQAVYDAILAACEKTGVPCYDMYAAFHDYLWQHDIPLSAETVMKDVLHPNDKGYELMFDIAKKLMQV